MPKGKVKVDIEWDPIATTPKVVVLYFNNGHGTAPPYEEINRGSVAPERPDPSAGGYTFDGWCLSPDGTKPWNFATKVYRHLPLYAKWIENATVTFSTDGHGTPPNPETVLTGSKIGKPADPTAEGYAFGGWFKDMTC